MSAFMGNYLLIALSVLGVLVLLSLLYAVLGQRQDPADPGFSVDHQPCLHPPHQQGGDPEQPGL